jgi:aspartyl aminopeptidase
MKHVKGLINFIDKAYTPYHVTENFKQMLLESGYEYISTDLKNAQLGKKYFTIFNDSALVAFTTPTTKENVEAHIVASHNDSPTFKLKPNFLMADNNYVRFNTEPYGGPIYASFMDKVLGVAGRLIVKGESGLETKLVCFEDDVVIPNVAIHMNREMNTNLNLNPQVDMLPLFSLDKKHKLFDENVLSHDLFLYNKEKGLVWGKDKEFVSSPKLDDLECAYASIVAMTNQTPNEHLNISVVFNNEEVGSRSTTGAASNILEGLFKKLIEKLGLGEYEEVAKNSLIVSADNAHAIHPNHPEMSDKTNYPLMNGGIVIKHQAGLSYTTDALSEAAFKQVLLDAKVPVQSYTNRSDKRGGGTLGSILLSSLPIASVDIGLAQLAMHSSFETAGSKDIDYLVEGLSALFNHKINIKNILINK